MIHVEGIGKRYRITEGGARYGTLRDAIAAGAARLVGRGGPRKTLNDFWALRDVSFDVNEGEVVGIIGRNGAGKSTLLKILSRITPPTEGRIRLMGRVASLLEVGTGFHPELTGRENIYMNGAILGMTRREIHQKMDEIVAFSGVEKFLETPVKHYSSGMYVRLAFAVAAHLEPEILIVDEVLAVGDLAFQQKCLGKMGEVAQGGRTVLFVSHNMVAVAGLTGRAVLLERGGLVQDGPTPDVIHTYLKEVRGQAADTAIGERKDREGNGRARLVGLSVTDADGHVNTMPMSRRGRQVLIDVEARESVTIEKVLVAWLNTERQRILWLDSSSTVPPFALTPGKHRFTVSLRDGVCPTPGEYFLNVALVGTDGMVDHVGDAVRVTIEQGDFFGTGKFPALNAAMVVDHKWKVE